jgi:hypothetical protein
MKLAFYLLLFSLRVFATEELIYSGSLYAKNGDTLEILVEREFGKTFITSREPWSKWVKRIKKLNPKLNLRYLSRNEEVVIQIPKEKVKTKLLSSKVELFDPKKNGEDFIRFATNEDEDTAFFATDLNDNSRHNLLFKKVKVRPDRVPENTYHLSLFYMGSAGTFRETATQFNNISATSQQNSPLSIGASFSRLREDYSYSGSVYLSYLNPGTTDFSGVRQEVDIPLEWGGNIYYKNKRNRFFAPVYYGFDIEKFSSFNTDELVLGDELDTREHMIMYATVGYDYLTTINDNFLLLRGSAARSFFSRANRKSLVSDKQFTGWRFTAYANFKPKGKIFYHLLYKIHTLEGPTKLTVQRIGLGFGVAIF